jgi:hypothetical protein
MIVVRNIAGVMPLLFNAGGAPSRQEIEATVASAVRVFLLAAPQQIPRGDPAGKVFSKPRPALRKAFSQRRVAG